MSSSSYDGQPYEGTWTKRARELDAWTAQHKVVVSATTASLVSTFTGFPLDSLKSRLQSSRESTSLPRLAADVIREEGVGGLWRGFPLPLITISIVRTISFTIYTSSKRILNSDPAKARAHAESGDGKGKGKSGGDEHWVNLGLGMFSNNSARDVALTSLLAGGASGAVVCVGSAPFELVKVRRQLEYQIFRDSHPEHFARAPPGLSVHSFPNTSLPQHPAGTSASIPSSSHGHEEYEHERRPVRPKPGSAAVPLPKPKGKPNAPVFQPPTTVQAVKLIVDKAGWMGLYTGWRLHFIRDTLGTALYFAEYDVMRFYLGRKSGDRRDGQRRGLEEQGELPQWAKGWLPKQLVPFMCGSVAGVTSWALIYPVDAIKTKAQQRALSGLAPRTPLTQLRRLVRGIDPDNPKPWLSGMARLYRGRVSVYLVPMLIRLLPDSVLGGVSMLTVSLGVSMVRSMLTHGLLWTIVDWANGYIDTKPFKRLSTHLA